MPQTPSYLQPAPTTSVFVVLIPTTNPVEASGPYVETMNPDPPFNLTTILNSSLSQVSATWILRVTKPLDLIVFFENNP